MILRNTIVAGNLLGPNCSFAVGSEGGNLQGDASCHFVGPKDRTVADPGLDAVANNGGATMTMAIQPDSLALDGGVGPCPATDQRGIARPQNAICDSGAFESTGPFPPPDERAAGHRSTSPARSRTRENTSVFTFTGTDNATAPEHLLFECRLIETDPTEPPEPPDPTAPPLPEHAWLGCQNPWQVKLIEDGLFSFEVRAIDRAGNVDETPAVHTFGGTIDVTPPQTFFLETPPNPSFSDERDVHVRGHRRPDPAAVHGVRVPDRHPRARGVARVHEPHRLHQPDRRHPHGARRGPLTAPTTSTRRPAVYTWTVGNPVNCDLANVTLRCVGRRLRRPGDRARELGVEPAARRAHRATWPPTPAR